MARRGDTDSVAFIQVRDRPRPNDDEWSTPRSIQRLAIRPVLPRKHGRFEARLQYNVHKSAHT